MNTQTRGTPVVVYNPLNIAREDVVEATVALPAGSQRRCASLGPDGKEVPAQIEDGKVMFVAKAPSVGYAVYDVEPARRHAGKSALKVTRTRHSKTRATASRSTTMAMSPASSTRRSTRNCSRRPCAWPSQRPPAQWPAWNMDFDQEQAAPRAFVGGPAQIRIIENGPARVAVEVTRETEGSKFVSDRSASPRATRAIAWSSATRSIGRHSPRTESHVPAHRRKPTPLITGTSARFSGPPQTSASSKWRRISGSI